MKMPPTLRANRICFAPALRFNDTNVSVAWLKFAALAGGARLATRELWQSK
jgi:hypothetical protein